MTKKEKIRILEGAIRLIRGRVVYGMCVAICETTTWRKDEFRDDLPRAHRFLTLVGIRRPKNAGMYWYPPTTTYGIAKRISLLKAAIKRLKTKQ